MSDDVGDDVFGDLDGVLADPAFQPDVAPEPGFFEPADLTSPRFAGDPHLEAIFDGLELMSFGWFGCSVKKVQQALLELGFDLGGSGVDGDFRTRTDAAVRGFQTMSGLAADGVVGPQTLRVLQNSVPAESAVPVDCGDESHQGGGPAAAAGVGTLSVTVSLGEEPVADANVSARSLSDPTARFGTTDGSGRHSFGTLPTGQYVVTAETAALGVGQTAVTLESGDLAEVVVQMVRQGQTRRPAAFGVRPLSDTGRGGAFFLTPGDPLTGTTKADREQQALAQARENARLHLNATVDNEEQRLRDEHPGLTLRFHSENFSESCDEPRVINTSSEGEGVGTVIIEEIEAACTASVHLVFESEEETVD